MERKTRYNVEISRQLKTAKKTEQQNSETEKSRTKDNGELRKFIDLRPFRVVTIVPLQSLQSDSRESGRVLEIRVQPSGKRQDSSSSGIKNPQGSREITITRYFNNF